ncbi:MAG: ATP-binding protein [Candidatus Omnitrophica bacterium CG11_big_fil_rev_8_21_14_0_20_45_26]|uniref:ATP-binding protein n=1 Tax=Candidatus Abzuiibacterium crystallinum TaxID=1974748 RepID=A0A2H0LP90_9BACT|nr:MAG: ATP-binding protein [Candidatus Omnitrophica bacterium CG11_big_fil_rev_8_21_14_0_20_45_26]PIW64091.1 MAG: ATP-binding protein [Candidatus Omnitrophica bacterium CG12_big_fil_rev_8_21_14_0_65_45_16]
MMTKEKILMCWSGGKDSALALYELQQSKQYEVAALLTTVTAAYERVSMHGVRRELLRRQAHSLGIPLCEVEISVKATNEEYETKMKETLLHYYQHGIRRVAFGDIFLEDLKRYREANLAKVGMTGIFPIWKRATTELIQTFIDLGFSAYAVCIDPKVLDPSFAGRALDRTFVKDLPKGVDPCGENGEFHSFVWQGPQFSYPVACTVGEKVLREGFWFCDLLPVDQMAKRA